MNLIAFSVVWVLGMVIIVTVVDTLWIEVLSVVAWAVIFAMASKRLSKKRR